MASYSAIARVPYARCMAIAKNSKPARVGKAAKEPNPPKGGRSARRTQPMAQAGPADAEAPPAAAYRNDETTRDGFRATPREDRAG